MIEKAPAIAAMLDRGGFVVKGSFPGFSLPHPTDHGLGPLAIVADSCMAPGTLIPMHEHVHDEIVSWVPDGVMRHTDRAGCPLIVDAAHLMVMNAGRSFWHEERTLPGDPPLRMLQILIRPREPDLEPRIQYGPLDAHRPGEWRHLFGPPGTSAPFSVRNAIDGFDIRIEAGTSVDLPVRDGWRCYFYVFTGMVEAEGAVFGEVETGLCGFGQSARLTASRSAVVVAFLVDPSAKVSRTGSAGDGETARAFAARVLNASTSVA